MVEDFGQLGRPANVAFGRRTVEAVTALEFGGVVCVAVLLHIGVLSPGASDR